VKVRKRIAVCATSTAPLWELSAIWDHTVLPATRQVTFPPLPQPIKAVTRFSNPGGMQGWVDLVGLVTYRGGIPARRRSPIPVLTGLIVEQLRSCDERRYHIAKPPTVCNWYEILPVSALKIHVSPCTKELLDDYYTFVLELRGPVAMKVVFITILWLLLLGRITLVYSVCMLWYGPCCLK